MNCSSHWKRLQARWARGFGLGSLALSLGLAGPVAAQLPQSLPPYNTMSRPAAATPASYSQEAAKDAPPRETPGAVRQDAPPLNPPMAVEPAASCSTCAPGGTRGGGIFNHTFGHGLTRGSSVGGCATGGCASGGCSSGSCGSGGCVNGTCGPMPCYSCGYNGCFPGHQNCCPVNEHCGPFGRFWSCFYHCLCCPDPCYEPRYIVEANSAFWVDGARPVTMTRIRWDAVRNFTQLDRSEVFYPKFGGKGPGPVNGQFPTRVNRNALTFYQEAATKRASFFIEQDYSSIDTDIGPDFSGFGDMNLGTKALLFDCELIQLTFQFRTYLPVGNSRKMLGVGHVALEPSLLTTVKLAPETYFQGQIAERIPIAADPIWGGSMFQFNLAVNHVLYRAQPDMPFIGSLELNGYSFQDGLYTDGAINGQPVGLVSSGDTWWTFGPGLRTSICNKLDLGFSAVFGLGSGGPEQIYRTEMRLRF